jgi:medium-chain acyl-[acyl-carrier-protein] hydrolase
MHGQRSQWLEGVYMQTNASLRVFALPYAGGNAYAYRSWQTEMPEGIQLCPIQLPGRGGRLRESPYTRMEKLIPDLGEALAPYCDVPFALWGHSMGGLISYELTHYLLRAHGVEPQLLALSGCTAAHLRTCSRVIYNLSDDSLINELSEYGGSPREVLANREMMAHLLPTLRADIELVQTYRFDPRPLLKCRVHAFAGAEDKGDSVDNVRCWSALTSGPFELSILTGGHFFIASDRSTFSACLHRSLKECARAIWLV